MPDADKILSQSEVDALLSAIGSGEVEVSQELPAEPPAVAYDFKRPQRVSRDQLRSIETLHEVYARNLQAAFSGLLRTVVDVKVSRVDQLSFQEFIHSLPNPTVITVLTCEPLEGNFVLELNPSIAFPVIERLLGSGRVGGAFPERPFTRIEWNLAESVIGRALDLMREVWVSVAPVQFKVSARETEPPLIRVLSPNEAMVSVTLEISFGEHRGNMNLALPVLSIEGCMERIAAHTWLSPRRKESAAGQEAAVSKQLAPAEVVLSVHLPPETMTLRELEALRPGDLVLTSHPKDAPLRLSVEGREKFDVKVGSLRDRKAFRVSAVLEPGREAGQVPARLRMGVRPSGPESEESARAMRSSLDRLQLQESVVLAEKTARLRDVIGIRVGEILEFPKRVEEPLELRVHNCPVAEGTAVKIGEKFGLHVGSLRVPAAPPPPARPPSPPAP